ncbi:HdeD family acid-resistance protein [Streptomyces djakartensis]|uniref:Membrane protein n=1 Tax=Streptomyces djakartensis TaxID=68193 RepID=A0ABQ2ZYW1_9ACTN|nr:HdeD family acid-resistance protein [Streptomyces djakartensis]GGY27448.1 membrane protein [Streptomyces djakartensis]
MTSSSDSPTGARTGSPYGAEPQDTSAGGLAALANLGWQILLVTGLASLALGVVVLAWPEETLRVVGVLFGVYLLVLGVFQLAAAFGAHVPRHLRALHFLAGTLSVLLGLICFRGTMQSILLLALWIGFSWLLRGTMVTATAVSSPEAPARGWMLFTGIIGMLAGIVLIVSPFASIGALTLAVGVMAIVLGVIEVFQAVRMRVEAGRLTSGTPAGRRPLFRSQPHPQH